MGIVITVTVVDEELLEDYKDIHPDLIIDDLMRNPGPWFENSEIACINTEFEKTTKDK